MLISKKRFEREVEKRIAEVMCRRDLEDRIREVRHDTYMEVDRLRERVDRIESVLRPAMDANVEPVDIYIQKR